MTDPRDLSPPIDLPAPGPEAPAPPGAHAPAAAEAAPRAGRERTCVGCGEHDAPEEMVRLVLGPSGEVAVDAAGGGFGRGAHVHARGPCLAAAAARGLMRATKGKAREVSLAVKEGGEVVTGEGAPLSAEALARAVEEAMARRIAGLLASAVRVRKVRIGADAVTGAWRTGEAELIMVATDAAAAAELGAVREAVAAGAAVAWGTKLGLAAALMRRATPEGVGAAAITDAGIAAAVRDAVEKSMGARSTGAPAKGSRRPVKVTAPRGGIRGKVEPERAGRASGRHLRRAQASRQ